MKKTHLPSTRKEYESFEIQLDKESDDWKVDENNESNISNIDDEVEEI